MTDNCTSKPENQEKSETKMEINKELFGKKQGEDVFLYTLSNTKGMEVKIITLGGIVTSLSVPDRNGDFEDIVLGFDNLQGYIEEHPYFGALIGRYGNRIAKGHFVLDGREYQLATNDGNNHLHGGDTGFDKVIWEAEEIRGEAHVGIKLSYLSKDLEEGYPGNLSAIVEYSLTEENELKIYYAAETDKATPVNLTHHSYFNLAACTEDVLNHEVTIFADKYTAADKELIPYGELKDVKGTPMDFLSPHTIGSRIAEVPGGYDLNYVLNSTGGDMTLAARVYEPKSGRMMEVYSTEPGLQFYTGNFLDGTLTGKNGKVYKKHFGFCMETQHFPDSPNQPSFPSTILRPGEKYTHSMSYKFLVKK
jgi:aldose 1-epimerase